MNWSIEAIETEVSSRRRVTLVWTELTPGGYKMTESPGCLDTGCHPVRVNFDNYLCPPAFLVVGACGREVGTTEFVGGHFV